MADPFHWCPGCKRILHVSRYPRRTDRRVRAAICDDCLRVRRAAELAAWARAATTGMGVPP